jgi:tetratricopeptide (TPR) repeat protein
MAAALDGGCPVEKRVHQVDVALRRADYERFSGNPGASLDAAQAAVRLAQEAGDRVREAKGRRAWGATLIAQGEYDAARQQFEQALALARESGARRVEAQSLTGLSWVLWSQSTGHLPEELAELWAYRMKALSLYREIGDRRGEADALSDLGVMCVGEGDLVAARSYYEQARAIQREIGNRNGEAVPLGNLAWVYWGEDDYAGAITCLQQALAIRREVQSRAGEASTLFYLGQSVAAQGYYARGEAFCRDAVYICRETGRRDIEGHALTCLGLVRYHQGDNAGARALLEEARPLCREFAARWVEGKRLAILSLVFHGLGDHKAARDIALQALENGPADYPLGQGDSALVLGHALAGLGDTEGATAAYEQALQRYRQSGFLNPPMEALAGLARVALEQGDPAQALLHVEEILDHLQAHTLDGTYEPFRVYWTCYRVLRAHHDPRAAQILHIAYTLLQQRAAGIEDENLRRSFLENVEANRRIVEEWAARGG